MPTKEQARQVLENLIEQYKIDQAQHLSESDVIEKYLLPLFRDVLGWPTDYEHFRNELTVSGGRVDRLLIADNGERIYIEAKRFKVIDALEKIESDRYMGEIRRAEEIKKRRLNDALGPQQLALPSMAVDRTAEEQQAINYAFQNGGQWAILSNFERLRLFNARRDWLVLSFENPNAFLQDFDLLWQLSYESILNGSLDYLSNQRFRVDVDSKYLELIDSWRIDLANDLLSNQEANPWIVAETGSLALAQIRNVVQRIIDRLVIVRFAEDHLVVKPGTLHDFYELRRQNIYAPSMISLIKNLFRNFDHEHNSALFSEGIVDQAIFSDDVLMRLAHDLYLVKFRAMPADILGNTYEQYLGKALVQADDERITTRDNLETRKKQGSYYTPQVIVRYIVDNSLGRYLYGTEDGKPDGEPLDGERRKTSRDIMDLRVLDSACGSGSFLIYAYQVLRDFYEGEIQRLNDAYKEGIAEIAAKFEQATVDDNVRVKQYELELNRIRNYPTLILEQHLYGVDLDPQAAEIAVVNLMMRAMEKQGTEKRLPLILNQNVKVGNALIGLRPDDERLAEHQTAIANVRKLRADLKATANTDPQHDIIQADLEAQLSNLRATLNAHYAEHFTDLDSTRLFHWGLEFPEVFFDETGALREGGGFQVIIGNPPYGAKLSRQDKDYFGDVYNLGTTDTAALFVKQALNLMSSDGINGYIIPKSLTYSSRWQKTRDILKKGLRILVDCGKVWQEVNLEQSIYIYFKNKEFASYDSLIREDLEFLQLGTISKFDVEKFGFFLNGVTPEEITLAHKLKESEIYLDTHVTNTRGAGLQSDIVEKATNNLKVLSGAQIQSFHVDGARGYISDSNIPDNARVVSDSILVQNIVAHVQNPVDHIKIISTIPTQDISQLIILDTVNQLKNNSSLSTYFFLGLLHSELINWFVYRFIFAKAIRTMHFDGPVTQRIPMPEMDLGDKETQHLYQKVVDLAMDLTKNPQKRNEDKLSQLNEKVYKLYRINDEEMNLIKSKMPKND